MFRWNTLSGSYAALMRCRRAILRAVGARHAVGVVAAHAVDVRARAHGVGRDRVEEAPHPGALDGQGAGVGRHPDDEHAQPRRAPAAERGARVVGRGERAAEHVEEDGRHRRDHGGDPLDDHVDGLVGEGLEVEGLLVGVNAPGERLVEHLLERRERHRRDHLEERREQSRPDAVHDAPVALLASPMPTATRSEDEAEVVLGGDEGLGWRGHGHHLEAHVGREIGDDLARHPQGVGRLVHAVEEHAPARSAVPPRAGRTRTR